MKEKKLTGYPSIDKPWLKYYSEESVNPQIPSGNIEMLQVIESPQESAKNLMALSGRKRSVEDWPNVRKRIMNMRGVLY